MTAANSGQGWSTIEDWHEPLSGEASSLVLIDSRHGPRADLQPRDTFEDRRWTTLASQAGALRKVCPDSPIRLAILARSI